MPISDYQIVRSIAKALSCPTAYHVGSPGCKRCNGTGFVPTPLWYKLKAHYIDGLPWDGIRKEIWCMSCEDGLILEEPEVDEPTVLP